MSGLQQPTWLNISAVRVLQLDLESPLGAAFHAAPHFPCISLQVGPPAPEAVPLPRPAAVHVAHSPRGVLSHAPRTRSSVCDVLGHVVPQQRQERRPSAGAARGSTPHRMGTPALPATGPPPPCARLLQDKAFPASPAPLVAECDPTCMGCTGKGPAQCRECIAGYSKEGGQCEGQRLHLLHRGLPGGHVPVWVGPRGGTQLLPSHLCLSPPQTTARCSC